MFTNYYLLRALKYEFGLFSPPNPKAVSGAQLRFYKCWIREWKTAIDYGDKSEM